MNHVLVLHQVHTCVVLDSEITFAMFIELIACSEGYLLLLVISDFRLVNLSGLLDVVVLLATCG